MEELSPKEQSIYKYILECIDRDGYSPSVREVQAALGIKSTATVYTYIEKLKNKGYLKKSSRTSRSYRPGNEESAYRVPVVGKVTAGVPISAIENLDGFYSFYANGASYDRDSLFALRVSGRSMIDAGIMDGDLIIVEKTSVAENGQIVVAMIDDESTVKRFFRENNRYRLQPENKEMEPIITDSVTILGRVVANVRYY